jgi:leukotriene-A4 hydrolase|tara:strand:+ start:20122 stop:22032 length:1911 start_codon:yes stop_codon:yes gene_type:complete
MKFTPLIFLSILISLLASCEEKPKKKIDIKPAVEIVKKSFPQHSYSNIKEVHTTHLHLDLDVDFDKKTIYGVARHEMKNYGAKEAIFDIKGLKIQKVTLGHEPEAEIETNYVVGESDSILGEPLTVTLDSATTFVNIYYQTTEKSEALDWLDPEMTGGKKLPFLYSQGEAILTRSWIPLQDVPSNRITYSADVKVPKEMLALMSAENPVEKNEEGIYHFEMKQAIPSYLIAIAVGDLVYEKLGENCGVYSEPNLIDKCVYEFEELPLMIKSAEKLFGKYQWEQYDIVILPYSFPFGGMENPRLTFANPTLIAGDRSLVSVIAHELAHSWSGNYVTNKTWNDFWLNEGFTVYIENRIMEDLYGTEVADMLALIEFQELEIELKTIAAGPHPYDTHLKLFLDGRNPDDGMTTVAYVKGAMFLKTLETRVGRANFDVFLKRYFKEYGFKTLTTEEFENFLREHLLNPMRIKFNLKEWLYEDGLPSNCVKIESKRFNNIQALANKLALGEDIFKVKWKKDKIKREDYTTQEWLAFIRTLPDTLPQGTMALIDKNLNFKACGNSEIMAEWFVLGIQNNYKAVFPPMRKFLIKVGRRKFIEPIFEELVKNADNKVWAKDLYKTARNNYHYITRSTVDEILNN